MPPIGAACFRRRAQGGTGGDRKVPPPAGIRILTPDPVRETQTNVSQTTPPKNGLAPSNATSRRWVDAVGCWCALGYGALAYLARQPGEPDLPVFFVLVAWTGLPVFGLYLYFRRRGETGSRRTHVPLGRGLQALRPRRRTLLRGRLPPLSLVTATASPRPGRHMAPRRRHSFWTPASRLRFSNCWTASTTPTCRPSTDR